MENTMIELENRSSKPTQYFHNELIKSIKILPCNFLAFLF